MDFKLEFFGPNHRDEEVGEKTESDDSDKDVFHGLKLSTRVGVNDAEGEKGDGHEYVNEVLQGGFPF